MKNKTLAAPLALALALALTGAASAQTLIGGQTVPADELNEVRDYCLDLRSGAPIGGVDGESGNERDTDNGRLSVDLTAINYSDCKAANLV